MKRRFLAAACLMSMPVLAAESWTSVGVVNSVYSHNGYHAIVTTIGSGPCGDPGKFWWPAGDADAKDMLAMALLKLTRVIKSPSATAQVRI